MTNTINSNTSKIYVLGHADSDGRYAMWCAYNHFRNKGMEQNLVLHEVQYGNPLPLDLQQLTKQDSVYIVDFSYKANELTELAASVGTLVVLDHHKSAQAELDGLQEKLQGICKAHIHFDMGKSGALLAWEYFNPGIDAPYICKLVNDRDMWVFEYGDETRSLECFIRSFGYPSDMAWWDKMQGMDSTSDEDSPYFIEAMQKGFVCLEYERAVIAKFARNPRNWSIVTVEFKGKKLRGIVYEGMGILHSELAEQFYTTTDIDFTMEWRRKEHEKIIYSLRSPKIDVSELAKAYGGGGHKAAAGFSLPLIQGFELVTRLSDTAVEHYW